MSAPPLTNREYAYFSISGPGRHEDVTALVGFTPSDAWNIGDINPRDGKPRRFMCWRLNSGLDDTSPLQLHIDNLLLYLGVKSGALRELWVDYDLTIHCTGHYPPSGHGLHLNREVVRQAARLGICFDCDFYYIDEQTDG